MELLDLRLELIENQNIILNWDYCLPAWQLYSGRIYSPIKPNNWVKSGTKVLIVSALFGIVKHTDLIPSYDLFMSKGKKGIVSFWKKNIDLNNFIKENEDIDLLSGNYRRAFNIDGCPIATLPNVIFADKYGTNKGIWLNNQLNNL